MRRLQFSTALAGRLFIALGISTALVSPALAQVEEIVVTARKRAENLQDVPIVITAFTAENIARKGIVDLADVAKYTSGVMLDIGASRQDTRIVIRGLSPTRGRQNVAILQDDVDISSLSQLTAGGSFVINPRLLDVERIEVVKGPHSALYGRSAFNGAIHYITKRPGQEFMANAQVDVGTDQKAEARASVSGPVSDKLALGMNASVWNFGGYYDSAVTGKGLGGGSGWGIAPSFTADLSDTVRLFGRVEYSDDNFAPEPRVVKLPQEVPLPSVVFQAANGLPAIFNPAVATNLTFPQAVGTLGDADDFGQPAPSRNPRTGKDYIGADREIFRATVKGEFETDNVVFTSITHYGDNKTFQFQDFGDAGDFASAGTTGGSEVYFDTKIRLVSQEFRAQSNYEADFTWTVGALGWNEEMKQLTRSLICVATPGACAGVFAAATDSTFHTPPYEIKRTTYHWSGYGVGEYAITDKLKASVEARYTIETEHTGGPGTTAPSFYGCPLVGGVPARNVVNGVITCLAAGPLTNPANTPLTSTNFNSIRVNSIFWTPRFTLDYKATEDVLVYVSAALGKKPGGLGTVQNALTPATAATNIYEPEEMWAYELGFKSTLMDGMLQLNGAAYYQDYSKKQVSITFLNPETNQLSTRVVNAAKAEVKGFELDANFAPSDFFSGQLSYTYNDGKYKDFTDITTTASTISRAAVNNPNVCTVVAILGVNRCQLNYKGNRLEGAPKHSLTMGGEIRGDITSDMGWFFDTDARYQTKRFTSFENSLVMESYWLVDIRAGLKTDTWNITAYVNNAFNDDTMKNSAVYIQAWSVAYLPPRNNAGGLTSHASGILPDKRLFGLRASMDF